jgi:PEGA domain
VNSTRRLAHLPWALIVAGATMPSIPAWAQTPSPAPVNYSLDGPRWHGPDSGARIEVTPKEAEVYVDGRLVGKVKEFAGFTDRLEVRPGGHELVLYLDGYRTIDEKLYFQPGSSYKIKGSMEKLGAGESSGARPEAPAPPPRPPSPPRRTADQPYFGTLAIRVQPPEATVWIDGEPWDGPEGRRRLAVQVAEGTHRVEVHRDGFETFATSVRVREGEVTSLNVSLSRADEQ